VAPGSHLAFPRAPLTSPSQAERGPPDEYNLRCPVLISCAGRREHPLMVGPAFNAAAADRKWCNSVSYTRLLWLNCCGKTSNTFTFYFTFTQCAR
jgi:hypothetical protein